MIFTKYTITVLFLISNNLSSIVFAFHSAPAECCYFTTSNTSRVNLGLSCYTMYWCKFGLRQTAYCSKMADHISCQHFETFSARMQKLIYNFID